MMEGLLFLLDQLGRNLADANQREAAYQERIAELEAQLADQRIPPAAAP